MAFCLALSLLAGILGGWNGGGRSDSGSEGCAVYCAGVQKEKEAAVADEEEEGEEKQDIGSSAVRSVMIPLPMRMRIQ